MNSLLVVFAFLLAFAASAPLLSCPSADDLYPCDCNRLAFGLQVTCENFDDASLLIKAFKVLRDYEVQNVFMYNLRMTEVLPHNTFDGLEISELRVEKSNLKFSEPAFSGLDESLHILNVAKKSMIKSSENFSIARLTQLTELNIKANPLYRVSNRWLNGKIPNVQKIILDEDEIEEIEDKAFADLPNLQSISIAENRIKNVKRSMFPRPAKQLKKIDLSGNEIQKLPYDFFFDMPKLEDVVLFGNDLSTLDENTWKSVWEQLDSVALFENNLVCDEKLNWLKQKKLRWPNHVDGTCVLPKELKGKSLKEVYKT